MSARGRGGSRQPHSSRTSSSKTIPLHLLSTPSRAHSIPKKGEQSLLDEETQERYRKLIQGKIDAFLARYPFTQDGLGSNTTEAKEMGSNILLLFRKLREGLVASSRVDEFALEVYETSACWSVLLNDVAQSTSIMSQIPDLHRKLQEHRPATDKAKTPHLTRGQTVATLQALHLLRVHHPSQTEFRVYLASNSSEMVPARYRSHLSNVAAALRRNVYARLDGLTDPDSHPLLRDLPRAELHVKALVASFGRIRDLARPEAWRCLHAAYREVAAKEDGERWFARSLLLKPDKEVLSDWMNAKCKTGEAAKKPGGEGGAEGWTLPRQVKKIT